MRVVSMVPSWTETLLECGCEVVGRTRFCIHPERVRDIPIVGGTKSIDWDKVGALNADLLLLDREENTRSMSVESPIEVFATHVTSVDDLAPELERLSVRPPGRHIGLVAGPSRRHRVASSPARSIDRPVCLPDLARSLDGDRTGDVHRLHARRRRSSACAAVPA